MLRRPIFLEQYFDELVKIHEKSKLKIDLLIMKIYAKIRI